MYLPKYEEQIFILVVQYNNYFKDSSIKLGKMKVRCRGKKVCWLQLEPQLFQKTTSEAPR